MTQQLVVVDDSEFNRDAVLDNATLRGWQAFGSDGTQQPDGLKDSQPILVLLDFVLGKAKPEKWLEIFMRAHPSARVYLLTGHEDDRKSAIDRFKQAHAIVGVLRKPFDLSRLPTLVEEVHEPPPEHILEQAADQLEPAIRILKKDTLAVLAANTQAKKRPWSAADRMVQRMAEELDDEPDITRVYRTDWDPKVGKFLRRRLYRAGPDWYWLAEDWKSEVEDEEFLHLLMPKRWKEQLAVLADIFSQHWGVTRMRYYRVARLAGSEEGLDCFLMRPMWQMGDGFAQDEPAWLADEFLFRDNSKAEQAFADPGQTWLLSEVHDADPSSRQGCSQIVWGNAGTRAEIPLWDNDQPIALLALDRRSDHLDRSTWAEDEIPGPLTNADMQKMEGYLEATESFLINKVKDQQSERAALWRETLEKVVRDAMGGGDARDALGRVFEGLREVWDAKAAPLTDLLFLRQQPGGLLTLWAGSGPRWESLSQSGRSYEAAGFLLEVPVPFRVVQDLAESWEALDESARRALSPLLTAEQEGAPKGGLLLLPFLQNDQHPEGLLLAFIGKPNRLSEPRVRALLHASRSIHGLLRWGLAQAERDWLSRALAHEFRKPTNLLDQAFRHLPEAVRPQAEGALRILQAGIQNLRYLAHPDLIQQEQFEDIELATELEDVVACLGTIYSNRILPRPPLPWRVHVPRVVLFQVLYNLLDNACKYSTGPQSVWLEAREAEGRVRLTVFNRAAEPIAEADREHIWLPYVRAERQESATGAGIGLAVLRQLCDGTHLACRLSQPGSQEEPVIGFTVELPINGYQQ